jgi:hypothetical protein
VYLKFEPREKSSSVLFLLFIYSGRQLAFSVSTVFVARRIISKQNLLRPLRSVLVTQRHCRRAEGKLSSSVDEQHKNFSQSRIWSTPPWPCLVILRSAVNYMFRGLYYCYHRSLMCLFVVNVLCGIFVTSQNTL